MDPLAEGKAVEKLVTQDRQVPEARAPAKTLYDISQALSFIASRSNNPEESLLWQSQIPELLSPLEEQL